MIDEPDATSRPDPNKPIALGGPAAPKAETIPPSEVEAESTPPVSPAAPPVEKWSRPILPLLGVLGFVVLAGAIAYLWVRPVPLPPAAAVPPDESGPVTALQSDVTTLKTQLAALDTREKADVSSLRDAIAAIPAPAATAASAPAATLASAPTPTPAMTTPSDAGLAQQITALNDRLYQIEATQRTQVQQTQSLPPAATISSLASRVDAIAQREAKDGDSIRQDLSVVQQQLATVTGQAQTLAKDTSALPQLTVTSDRLSQIVRAQEALRAGQPLGPITNAPPALARFASSAPPTEAALRLSFPDAARAAEKAGQPLAEHGGFWHRVWLRMQDLIIVRQGDRVLVGDPTSGVLAHAQRLMDAGDLAGALTVLGTLTGPAAAAIAPWEAQAQSLIAARQALAQMAAG